MVPLPNVIIDEETRQPEDAMAQLLMTHYQYGHAPMRKLQAMAEQGIIPKRLARCRIPVCSACLYAKATRKPWRGKTRKNEENDEGPTAPGHVVSVDQLVSPTPGLIAQMTGFLTTKRYKYATVYVDQFSRFGYVHLQKTATAEETVEGNEPLSALQNVMAYELRITTPTTEYSRQGYGRRHALEMAKGLLLQRSTPTTKTE